MTTPIKRTWIPRLLGCASIVGTALFGSGCVIVHDGTGGTGATGTTSGDATAVNIDVAEGQLSTTPGNGVSIIVEYGDHGRWTVTTTCDTARSGASCGFDIYARAAGIRTLSDNNLEASDYVEQYGDEIHASFDTDVDTDGISVDTPVGASLELEVYLDGSTAAPYVFWIGDNQEYAGAPSNPTLYVPPS